MAEPQLGAGGRRASRRVPKTFLHASSSLIKGSIIYNVKYWGSVEVSKPKGADIVKQAIDAISSQIGIIKLKGGKTMKATLGISYKAIRTVDARSKNPVHVHPLGAVTYAGDDKTNKSVFAYIAQDPATSKFFCYVYGADSVASQISLTVAQAFDVAFKEFNKTLGADKAKIRKKIDTVQKAVEDAATGAGPAPNGAPAAAAPVAPVAAPEPSVPATSAKLTAAESIDDPGRDQGFFEPFDLNSAELPAPVFGPGIDDIDDAIKSIEDQVGGLLEGFGEGFALDGGKS
ncbi:PTB domain-containing engulfment adapter protein 1-like [Sycon ciliatum]|uniref:PTB domain-containing engulfment adapter protein 1-like n=1 Tax=Sycon ciliatum TaxID=27933 RepID=UPI0031F63E79